MQQAETVTEARFEEVRRSFETLGEALSDDQLLALADTYHEILRLRRCRRATQARLLTEGASFARAETGVSPGA